MGEISKCVLKKQAVRVLFACNWVRMWLVVMWEALVNMMVKFLGPIKVEHFCPADNS
jgi:hypothetical protein